MTGPSTFEIDDFEEANREPAAKTEDELPEELKGKSPKQLADAFNAMRSALSISEDARKSALDAARSAGRAEGAATTPRAAPVEEKPVQLTKEDLEKRFAEDPLGTIGLIVTLNNKEVVDHYERRIAHLTAGGAANAEKSARAEYPMEFELFGPEIKQFVDGLQDKSALNTPEGWDNVVSYVRGKKGNLEKIIEAKSKGKTSVTPTREQVREREREQVGFSGTNGSVRNTPEPDDSDLDDVESKIAEEFIASGVFKDKRDYKRWKNPR